MADFVLTPLEVLCGVKLEEVERVAARALPLDGGLVVLDDIGPALAGAAARMKLGHRAHFVGFNSLGQPVYQQDAPSAS